MSKNRTSVMYNNYIKKGKIDSEDISYKDFEFMCKSLEYVSKEIRRFVKHYTKYKIKIGDIDKFKNCSKGARRMDITQSELYNLYKEHKNVESKKD